MASKRIPHGVASLYLASGISFLHQEEAVFEAMLAGWGAQRVGGRQCRRETSDADIRTIKRFQTHAESWPWYWSAQHMDEWMLDLTTVQHRAPSTIRKYQSTIRQFCEYITSEHYDWATECERRFGTHPIQICHEWNTSAHLHDYEGNPSRRSMTRDEVQLLFDYADDEIARLLNTKRKGALTAYRDAVLLRVAYAWGLRPNEAVHLDTTDFFRNPHAPEFGDFGVLLVRHGKGSRGSSPKRRSVVTLRDWAVEAVQDYLSNVRPLMRQRDEKALFLSERGTRLRTNEMANTFARYRDALKLEGSLSPHCLRHSYVTHLIEDGVDPTFVQRQVGHEYQSTTAIYTHISGDFANKMMRDAIEKLRPEREEDP